MKESATNIFTVSALYSRQHIVSDENGIIVSLVRPSSLPSIKAQAQQVGIRANWDTKWPYGLYCAQDAKTEVMEFTHSSDQRTNAIAFMLLEKRTNVFLGSWVTDPVKVSDEVDIWTVGFIWVLRSFRRNGIGLKLVREACRFTGLSVQELAWCPPFSSDGELLVKSVCPDEFLIATRPSKQCD